MNRNMMRQAQKMQAQLQKIQEELETLTVEGSAGGGVVKSDDDRQTSGRDDNH